MWQHWQKGILIRQQDQLPSHMLTKVSQTNLEGEIGSQMVKLYNNDQTVHCTATKAIRVYGVAVSAVKVYDELMNSHSFLSTSRFSKQLRCVPRSQQLL